MQDDTVNFLGQAPIPTTRVLQLAKSEPFLNAIPLTSKYSDPVLDEYIVQFVASIDEDEMLAFHFDPDQENWIVEYDSREHEATSEEAADEAEAALQQAAADAGYDHNNLKK